MTRLSRLRPRKEVIVVFWKKDNPVWCPICHVKMKKVDYKEVDCHIAHEWARLNMWDLLSQTGWYLCPICRLHVHAPTVKKQKQRR